MTEPSLRGAAIRALANLDDAQTPSVILQRYAQLSAQEKRDAVGTLTARPAYAFGACWTRWKPARCPSIDLHAYNVRQIVSFNHPEAQ